jgi:hypothetical protein
MKLPTVSHPTFTLNLPSTGQTITYRPFLVKEEKILLIAQSSEDQADIVRAIKQVITNCIIEPRISVEDFTTFDLEYFFIKLRAKSVQNVIRLQYRDNEDKQVYDVEVDLESIEVTKTEEVDNNVQITPDSGLVLKFPTMKIMNDVENITNPVDFNFAIMQACIDCYYEGDRVYKFSEFTREDIQEFIEGFDIATYQKMQAFIDSMPRIEHTTSYTNSNGKVVEIKLRTLNDFFSLG